MIEKVAQLAELSSDCALRKARRKMCLHSVGRKILQQKPLISSKTINLESLKQLPHSTLGWHYSEFLLRNNISPDNRSPITEIKDPELAYVMLRYRQVHDFMHVLFDLDSISVESEILLKMIEFTQLGMPMNILAVLGGPWHLKGEQKIQVLKKLPWAIQSGSNACFLLNVDYEHRLDQPLDQLRRDLNIFLNH